METVSRLVVTNQCPACRAIHGDRNVAQRHVLSSIRRGFCRDRSRYLGQVHIPLSLCCPVCAAEPSELQQHLAEHFCDVFKNGFGNASLKQAQVRGGGLARAGPAGSATGGGRGRQRSRCSSALATLCPVNAAELRELTATVFKTYLVPCVEPVAEAMAEAGRFYHKAAGAMKDMPEAERAEVTNSSVHRARVGGVPAQLDEGVGA